MYKNVFNNNNIVWKKSKFSLAKKIYHASVLKGTLYIYKYLALKKCFIQNIGYKSEDLELIEKKLNPVLNFHVQLHSVITRSLLLLIKDFLKCVFKN